MNVEKIEEKIKIIWSELKDYRIIPPPEYIAGNLLIEIQGYSCLICESKNDLIHDHCHQSGMVRSILCRRCNVLEGLSGNTRPWKIYRAYAPANGWFFRYSGMNEQWKSGYEDPLPERVKLNEYNGSMPEEGALYYRNQDQYLVNQYKKLLTSSIKPTKIPYTCYRRFDENGKIIPFDNELLIDVENENKWPIIKISLEPKVVVIDCEEDLTCSDNFCARKIKSSSERRYRAIHKLYEKYCTELGINPTPIYDQAVENIYAFMFYSVKEKGIKSPTITVYKAALVDYFTSAGYDPVPAKSPRLGNITSYAKNVNPHTQRKVKQLNEIDIRAMIGKCDIGTTIGIRDRAIIALAFCGGFRRSEIAALRMEDIKEKDSEGYTFNLDNTKTGPVEKK